jgi:hypothetical protein
MLTYPFCCSCFTQLTVRKNLCKVLTSTGVVMSNLSTWVNLHGFILHVNSFYLRCHIPAARSCFSNGNCRFLQDLETMGISENLPADLQEISYHVKF